MEGKTDNKVWDLEVSLKTNCENTCIKYKELKEKTLKNSKNAVNAT